MGLQKENILQQNQIVFNDNIIQKYDMHWAGKIDLVSYIGIAIILALCAISTIELRLLLWEIPILFVYYHKKSKYETQKLLETEQYFIVETKAKNSTSKILTRKDGIIEKTNGKIRRVYFDKNFIAQKEISQSFFGKKLGFCDIKIILKNKSKIYKKWVDVIDDNTRDNVINKLYFKLYDYYCKYDNWIKKLKIRYKILFVICASIGFCIHCHYNLPR